MKVGGWWM